MQLSLFFIVYIFASNIPRHTIVCVYVSVCVRACLCVCVYCIHTHIDIYVSYTKLEVWSPQRGANILSIPHYGAFRKSKT